MDERLPSGFTIEDKDSKVGQFFPLSSDLVREDALIYTNASPLGEAYSSMDMINVILIQTYCARGKEFYNDLLKSFKPYLDAFTKTELELSPKDSTERGAKVSFASSPEEFAKFLTNPNWPLVFASIRNSIRRIAPEITDIIPAVEANLFREINDTASTVNIRGLETFGPMPSMVIASDFLASHDFHAPLTLAEFHRMFLEGLIFAVRRVLGEKSPVGIADKAHDFLVTVLQCAEQTKEDPVAFGFSTIRYASTAPLIRDFSSHGNILACPFRQLCGNPILRKKMRSMQNESCTSRQAFAKALPRLEYDIPRPDTCCGTEPDIRYTTELSNVLPELTERLLKSLSQVIVERNECPQCDSIKSYLIDLGYTEQRIIEIATEAKDKLRTNLPAIIFPSRDYVQSLSASA